MRTQDLVGTEGPPEDTYEQTDGITDGCGYFYSPQTASLSDKNHYVM